MKDRVLVQITSPFPVPHEIEAELVRGKKLRIGRSVENDVVIPNRFISRQHLELDWSGEAIVARDLCSVNGILLNGKRSSAHVRLQPGDVIDLANVTLRVSPARSPRPAFRPEVQIQENLKLVGGETAYLRANTLRMLKVKMVPVSSELPLGKVALLAALTLLFIFLL